MKLLVLKQGTKRDIPTTISLLKLTVPRLKKFLEYNQADAEKGFNLERIDFFAEKLKVHFLHYSFNQIS